MRPELLSLEGFCSYRDPVEVDLGGVRHAVIVGANGAGKTSLLDAMVFALYGQPRVAGDIDSVVNTDCDRAWVSLSFRSADGARWRVTRSRSRDQKRTSAVLEAEDPSGGWRAMTTGGVRDTDHAVAELLGASWETLAATTFAAQGDLDRFASAAPNQRRHVLSEILRLDRFTVPCDEAKRRVQETDTRLAGIDTTAQALTARLADRDRIVGDRDRLLADLAAIDADDEQAQSELAKAELVAADAAEHRTVAAAEAATAATIRDAARDRPDANQTIHDEVTHLEGECDRLAAQVAAAQSAARDLNNVNAEVGRVRNHATELEDRLAEVSGRCGDYRAEAARLQAGVDEHRRAVKESRARLRALAASDQGVCFTCSQPLPPDTAEQLKARLSDLITAATAQAERQQIATDEALQAAAALDEEAHIHRSALSGLRDQIESLTGRGVELRGLVADGDLADRHLAAAGDKLNQARQRAQDLVDLKTRADEHVTRSESATRTAERLDIEAQELRRRANQRLEANRDRRADLNRQLGAADSSLAELTAAEQRLGELERTAATLRDEAATWAALAEAFGRDGVPAMILEGVTVELAELANDGLGAVSSGRLQVQLATQRTTKAGRSRDTLEVVVLDAEGTPRVYESYSGGEQRNIAAALRIGLARLLARRTGSAIRTLILDEGWGALDAESITANLDYLGRLGDEFDLILSVTHIDGVADAFPSVIRVEHDTTASSVTVESQ